MTGLVRVLFMFGSVIALFGCSSGSTDSTGSSGISQEGSSSSQTEASSQPEAAPPISLPKFSARCVTDDNIFILVSLPASNEMYWAREDGQYNSAKVVDVQTSEELISGKLLWAFKGFEGDDESVEFIRKTGEFKQISTEIVYGDDYAPVGTRDRVVSRSCEPAPAERYDTDLAQLSEHLQRELAGYNQKANAEAARMAEEEAERARAQNAPNKF